VQSADLKLVLPLAALFAAFFVSAALRADRDVRSRPTAEMHGLTIAHYAKFFTDPFNYSILWSTIVLGVKATLLCLLFGFPIAWICARAKAAAGRPCCCSW